MSGPLAAHHNLLRTFASHHPATAPAVHVRSTRCASQPPPHIRLAPSGHRARGSCQVHSVRSTTSSAHSPRLIRPPRPRLHVRSTRYASQPPPHIRLALIRPPHPRFMSGPLAAHHNLLRTFASHHPATAPAVHVRSTRCASQPPPHIRLAPSGHRTRGSCQVHSLRITTSSAHSPRTIRPPHPRFMSGPLAAHHNLLRTFASHHPATAPAVHVRSTRCASQPPPHIRLAPSGHRTRGSCQVHSLRITTSSAHSPRTIRPPHPRFMSGPLAAHHNLPR